MRHKTYSPLILIPQSRHQNDLSQDQVSHERTKKTSSSPSVSNDDIQSPSFPATLFLPSFSFPPFDLQRDGNPEWTVCPVAKEGFGKLSRDARFCFFFSDKVDPFLAAVGTSPVLSLIRRPLFWHPGPRGMRKRRKKEMPFPTPRNLSFCFFVCCAFCSHM